MKSEVAQSGRRLVTIIDPHIQKNEDYWVFSEGDEL